MASANINVSGLWKNVKQIYSNVGGTWQSIKSGWVNVGGLWKQFFSSGAYSDSGTTVSSTYSSYNSVFTPYITGTTSHWQNAVSLDYRIQKDPGSGFTTGSGFTSGSGFISGSGFGLGLGLGGLDGALGICLGVGAIGVGCGGFKSGFAG